MLFSEGLLCSQILRVTLIVMTIAYVLATKLVVLLLSRVRWCNSNNFVRDNEKFPSDVRKTGFWQFKTNLQLLREKSFSTRPTAYIVGLFRIGGVSLMQLTFTCFQLEAFACPLLFIKHLMAF